MNKFILGLLLIPVLLVGICAVSASLDDGGAEISIADDGVDSHFDFKYTGEKKVRALTLKDLEEFAKSMENQLNSRPSSQQLQLLQSLKEPMDQKLASILPIAADDGVDIAGISIAGDGVDSPSDFKYTGEKKIRALTLKDLEEFAKGMKNPIDPQPAPPEYLKSLKEPMYQQLWIVGLC